MHAYIHTYIHFHAGPEIVSRSECFKANSIDTTKSFHWKWCSMSWVICSKYRYSIHTYIIYSTYQESVTRAYNMTWPRSKYIVVYCTMHSRMHGCMVREFPRPTATSDLTLHFASPSFLAFCSVPFRIRIFYLSIYIHIPTHTYMHESSSRHEI